MRFWLSAVVLALFSCQTPNPEETEKRENAEAWIEAGFNAFREGRFEAAAGFYQRALMLTPDDVLALLGFGDSMQEWAEQLLDQAMRLHNAGRTGGAEEIQRSMQTVTPLIQKGTQLQEKSYSVYDHVRKKFKDNRTAYMKATFGLAKLFYYRIISPNSYYAFAEVERTKQGDREIAIIKDPLVREQLVRDREEAIKYLSEFVEKGEEQAVESRRWLASMLVARNMPGDKERALKELRVYATRLKTIRENAVKTIADPKQQKLYLEFIDREASTTADAIKMLEAPQ
jgi:tetratricopeptide (TPR) repeat protein